MKKIIGLFLLAAASTISVKSQDTAQLKKKGPTPYYDTAHAVNNKTSKKKVNIMDMQKKPLQKWPDSLATKSIDTLKKPD